MSTRSAVPGEFAPGADPRRWITLAISVATILIISLDASILNVSIPTILREFETTLPSLEWVVTGYALVFASLLVIGGRLGDLFTHRRVFIVGATLFGTGSLLAALSQSVPQLIIGEAVIEGVGAALMTPSSLAIMSNTFVGHERAIAFGAWGTVAGVGSALGPVIGGILTTNASWRWSFGINVIIVPFAIVGAVLFMPRGTLRENRPRLDLLGALLIACGTACLVFGLSEGGAYGWIRPTRAFTVAGHPVVDDDASLSIVAIAFVVGVVLLTSFVMLERAKERNDNSPLFEFGQLRHLTFRYGLLFVLVQSFGQLAVPFVMPIFLQEGRHLTPQMNGLWQLPLGLSFLVGSVLGSRLARWASPEAAVRIGVAVMSLGLLYVACVITPDLSFWTLCFGLIIIGNGSGACTSQSTNVVLREIEADKAGSASGAVGAARQFGLSIGVAGIGTLLTTRTIASATRHIATDSSLPVAVRTEAIGSLHDSGVGFTAPSGATSAQVDALHESFIDGLTHGARIAFLAAALAMVAALAITQLLPRRRPTSATVSTSDHALLEPTPEPI